MDSEHGSRRDHHSHGRGHPHAPAGFGKAFAIGVVLNTGFVVAEVAYGLVSHSLSLIADAGHNLGDVIGLLLAWGSVAWARRQPTTRHTYGWKRSSVMAALCNAIFLLVSVGVIGWAAVERLREPVVVEARMMIWVAAAGILVNGATAIMFMAGRKGDLNVRAAFLHNAGDAMISAGVVVAGIAIQLTGWFWLDPAVSLLLSAVIILGTWGLLRESFNLALDAVPEGIDPEAVRAYLGGLSGVSGVHHLHIWGLSTNEAALTAHVVLRSGDMTDNALLQEIDHGLSERFGISHSTIQLEAEGQAACAADGCGSPRD
jgi:cobalt-zinc-cadmium efflux system protein